MKAVIFLTSPGAFAERCKVEPELRKTGPSIYPMDTDRYLGMAGIHPRNRVRPTVLR
jgi:hypothetical protein